MAIVANLPGKAQHSRLIKPDKFRRILGVRAEIDDHHLATLQLREPIEAPAQHFNLRGHTGLHGGTGGRWLRVCLTLRGVVAITQVDEPRGNLAGFSILE